MSDENVEKEVDKGDGNRSENLRCEYDHALQIGQHSDLVIHEVAAIVWGANTLLLGFILEVPCESENQKLVFAAAVVGLFMTFYVPLVHHFVKKTQRVAFEICGMVEKDLNMAHRIHAAITGAYPKWRPGWRAIQLLTGVFIGGWIYVGYRAVVCICERAMR